MSIATALAAAEPAKGAELSQVIIATAGASVATAVLLWLALGHRNGKVPVLGVLSRFSERVSGLPGWAALPSGVGAGSLMIALLGMYWDIALHIDDGRDAGPLANPAHYLILVGLFGIFAAGVLGMVLPARGEKPGPAAIKITRDWYAPVGAVLMTACAGFALTGFPLDDVWHRLFGQDVTLWGPTHLMLIGGAGMTLIAQSVLLGEGMRAMRARREAEGTETTAEAARRTRINNLVTYGRRMALMGGLLIGLSTFQAEFDFGVPQYRMVFQPFLIALAAGVSLTAARIWVGPGGAIGAAIFFLAVRGIVSVIVGPVFGQTTPALPLYLGAALCVEGAALVIGRRPLQLGLVGGVLIGTVGMATEWAWSHLVMRNPWTADILPEALWLSIIAGVAGGLVGGLLAAGLRGELPRPGIARVATAGGVGAVLLCGVLALQTSEPTGGAKASVLVTEVEGGAARSGHITARIEPASVASDASWVTITAWQGGGLVVDRMRRTADGLYRSTQPIPLHGEWKAVLRVHKGDRILGVPVFLPADSAIPAPEVPALASFERPFTTDTAILQRERDFDVPGWLWSGAVLLVLGLYLFFIGALAVGVARVGRMDARPPRAATHGATVGPPRPAGA